MSTMTFLPANIHYLDPSGTNWAVFSARFRETMQVMGKWGYFDGTMACPTPKKPDAPTDAESEAIESWAHEDVVACYLLSQHLPDTILLPLFAYSTAKARWDRLVEEHTAKSVYAQINLENAFFGMRCPKGGNVQAFITDLRYKREELAAAGVRITDKEFQRTLLRGIPDELARFASQRLATARIEHPTSTVDLNVLIGHTCEKADRLKNRRARSQQGQQRDKKGEGLTGEAFAATQSEGRRRTQGRTGRRGKCHTCGEVGHWARECCAPKGEIATKPAAEGSSGATAQPETEAMEAAHTVIWEGEGSWIAEEVDAHTQNVVAELGLSRALPQSQALEVHAQTVVAEPHPILGELGGLEKVAHAQPVAAELDLPGTCQAPGAQIHTSPVWHDAISSNSANVTWRTRCGQRLTRTEGGGPNSVPISPPSPEDDPEL